MARATEIKWYATPGAVYIELTFARNVLQAGSPQFKITNAVGDPPYSATAGDSVVSGNTVKYSLADSDLTEDQIVAVQILNNGGLSLVPDTIDLNPYTQSSLPALSSDGDSSLEF